MFQRISTVLAAVSLLALPVRSAQAATATANLQVSATVVANCSISTLPVAFGNYDPVSANATTNLDGAGTVSVACTQGAAATITLDEGLHSGSGSTAASPVRRLQSGSSFLTYALYQNAGRSTVWGNTSGTGVAHSGNGSTTNLSVYGRIASGQQAPAGNYTDTVIATITF